MSARFVTLQDIHTSDLPPIGRTASYLDDIFQKLHEIGTVAKESDFVLLNGDLFHRKRPSFNSYDLFGRWCDVLREWPDTFAIAGNHDMTSGGLSSLWGQPIGGLHRAGALTILLDDRVVEYGGLRIQLSPANFDDNLDRDPANYALRRLKGVDWAIKMAHGMLVPPKKNPFPPNVQVTPMDTVPTTGMDICVFGHPHFDFGVKKVNGCYFVSTGALARVARRSENTDRTIRVMEVEIGAKGTQPAVRPVVLKSVRPASEVFLEKDATLSEVELEEPLRAFAKRMSAALQQDTRETLDGLIDRFGSRVKRRVRKFIHECLEEAGYV